MGLLNENFKKLIALFSSIPILEDIIDREKFIYFIHETLFTGTLPEFSQKEVDKLKTFLSSWSINASSQLKDEVINDIINNDIALVTNYQAESYLDTLDSDLHPMLSVFGELNLMDEIREKDLYPIPPALIFVRNDKNEKVRNSINQVEELHVISLKSMRSYTISQKKNYQLLYFLFNFYMDCYSHLREVMLEIEHIKERRGIGSLIKAKTNYCIKEQQIVALHKILNDVIIEAIDCADFMKCFDISNIPNVKLQYFKSQQNLMTYTLSLIKMVNADIALSNFGIKNYYAMKNRTIPKPKRQIQQEIDRVFA